METCRATPNHLPSTYVAFVLIIPCHSSFHATQSAADPQVAANGHPPTVDAVPEAITAHSKEIVGPEHVSGDTTDSLETLLGAVATASESVGAENVCHVYAPTLINC